jgi:hypothetical protein
MSQYILRVYKTNRYGGRVVRVVRQFSEERSVIRSWLGVFRIVRTHGRICLEWEERGKGPVALVGFVWIEYSFR